MDYVREGINPDRALILDTLGGKCRYKEIEVPTMEILANKAEREDIQADVGTHARTSVACLTAVSTVLG